MTRTGGVLFATAMGLALAALGCHRSGGGRDDRADLTTAWVWPSDDGGNSSSSVDLAQFNPTGACGESDPNCHLVVFDPAQNKPFPLVSDKLADPNVDGNGIGRDANGFLVINQSHGGFNHAWTANTDDWQKGTVSKWDTVTVRELARYFTVTCGSLPSGNTGPCDGKSGCCAIDSYPQFQNRQIGKPSGPFQAVQWDSHIQYASRTAIDFNGDMWVANRALYQTGAQSSVTKIANRLSECIDRNKNGRIDTSSDVNGDGIIETDCNGDGSPDDLAGVKAKPCTNGMRQEFYGLDDECILMTTNTGDHDGWGRPLALAPGPDPFGASDVWAGLFMTGQVFRIDGTTGQTKEMTKLSCSPYGFAIDSDLIGWSANLGPGGCYWDTRHPQNTGVIRTSTISQSSYGIGLDRDGNIWFGGTAARYTPVRKGSFSDLGNGYWTVFQGANGSGVAVDSRSPNAYFAFFAGGVLYEIPASTIPLPKGVDLLVQGPWKSVPLFGGGGKGVDIASDDNVIATSSTLPGLQRVKVDVLGNMTMPDLQSPAQGKNRCPTGDFCDNTDHGAMHPYTYSDFTGYGLRNFTRVGGRWTYVLKGCINGNGLPADTRWLAIQFIADRPANTKLTVGARSGSTPTPNETWGTWIAAQTNSPIDLIKGVVLAPNAVGNSQPVGDGYLEVEVDLQTTDKNKTPRLRSLSVAYECLGGPM